MTNKMMACGLLTLLLAVTLLTGCGGSSEVPDVTTGLLAYYPFNGNANDIQGSNNGTINDSSGTNITFTQDHLGNANQAISFSGLGGDVSLGSFTLPSTSFSVALWIKTGTSVNQYPLYCSLFDFRQETGTAFSFDINGSGTSLKLSSNVTQGTWTHIVGTYDETTRTATFYIDGQPVATNVKADALGSTDVNGFDMGASWAGAFDDLRIYNRVLTASEVDQLYRYLNN